MLVLAFHLANCTGFEKSTLWVGNTFSGNSKKDPTAYSEGQRLEYKTYRHYLRSLDRLHQKNLLDHISNDKNLMRSIQPQTPSPSSKNSN